MEDKLSRYKHLWTSDRDNYVLFEYVSPINQVVNYMIYDIKTKTGLLLEDDSISDQVLDEMLKAGVLITKEIPT